MTKAIKAGCILINTSTKQIGLIHRIKQDDYSFPKGHKEEDESVIDCAIRETIEETQRLPEILATLPEQKYTDSKGDESTVYWFLARDLGESHAKIDEELKHELIWVDLDKVKETLSYENLKELWDESKEKVEKYLKELN